MRTVLILIAVFCLSCKQPESEKVIVNEVPGKWIESGKITSISMSKIWSLGVADGNKQQEFYHPKDIAIDADNNVYILDSGNYKVRVFDKNGNFIYNFGNKGMGPGELSHRTIKIKFINGDTLMIIDSKLRRISFYTKKGDYLFSFNIDILVDDCVFLGNNRFIISNFRLLKGYFPLHLFNAKKGETVRSFGNILEPGQKLIEKVKNRPDQYFFSFGGITCVEMDPDSNIYFLQKYPYVIQKYNLQGIKLISFTRSTTFSTHTSISFDRIADNKYRWSLHPSAQTGNVQVIGDTLVVTSIFSRDKKNNSIDIYSQKGILLLSAKIPYEFDGPETAIVSAKLDNDYYFYCLYESSNSYPKLVKFQLLFN